MSRKLTTDDRQLTTICQVLHSLNMGGAEMLAFRLAQRLKDTFRFVFACLDDVGLLGADLRREGFLVESLGRRPGLDFSCARRLSELARRERVDVIHAHQYTPFAYSLLSGLLRRRPPVLFNEHGRFYPDYRSAKRVWFNRLMLRTDDRVVAVGNAVRQALVEKEGIAPSRIDVIYNGIDLSQMNGHPQPRSAVRPELGVNEDDFVVMQVARLDKIKDHATAVRTIAQLAARHPQVKLLLVGEGPERPNIEREIQRQGVESQVRLIGERRDVRRLLAGADVFLLTSVSEGIPVTLIEAMAAGLPIVATDVGGIGEVVEAGQTGLLAPPAAEQPLAAALVQLLNDPAQRTAMGQAGRLRAQSMFTEEKMHAAYAAMYAAMAE